MGLKASHHLVGLTSLCAVAGFLVGLPLVSADTRGAVVAPMQERLQVPSQAESLLLFAGFPGCQGACPTALKQLAGVQTLADRQFGAGRLAVLFVNLHLDTGNAAAAAYAQSFHPDFHGLTATTADRGELKSLLAQSGSTNIADLSRHSSNVYKYDRTPDGWMLSRVYASLPSSASLVRDIAADLAPLQESPF